MKEEIEDKWDGGGRVKDREVLRKVKAPFRRQGVCEGSDNERLRKEGRI